MIWHSAHRHAVVFSGVTRSQRQFKFFRANQGVVIKHLIEITQPEEKNSPRVILLD